jgi:hypothetical protein
VVLSSHGEVDSRSGCDRDERGQHNREARASPDEASPQRPAAGISSDGLCGEAGYRCGYGVSDQVPSRRPEDVIKAARETGVDRCADGPDEDVDRLRERPVACSEQEPGEDDGKHLQGKGNGESGMVIWAATAVTAAINAARVMVDAFNPSLSVRETITPATAGVTNLLLPPFVPGFRRQRCPQAFDSSTSG